MLSLEYTKAFERDVKRLKKRGKNLGRLTEVIRSLAEGSSLSAKNRKHKLTGNYRDHWECHVEPDFLLIYRKIQGVLVLVRAGTHSDLF